MRPVSDGGQAIGNAGTGSMQGLALSDCMSLLASAWGPVRVCGVSGAWYACAFPVQGSEGQSWQITPYV